MAILRVVTQELSSSRFLILQNRYGACPAHTLGVLILFWHNAREQKLVDAPMTRLEDCVPLPAKEARVFVSALYDAGYLELVPGRLHRIVDNVGWFELRARKTARMQKAQAALDVIHAEVRATRVKKEAREKKRALALLQKTEAKMLSAPKAQPELGLTPSPAPSPAPTPSVAPAAPPERTPFQELCYRTWFSYARAYEKRTMLLPTRNAHQNAMVQNLVKRLGAEAPEVIEYYVRHPSAFYQERVWPLNLAVSNAEALRTQLRTGVTVTRDRAIQASREDEREIRHREIRAGRL